MKMYVVCYVMAYIVSVVLATGWDVAYQQHTWPTIADKRYRTQLGSALIMNVVFQVGWPIFLPTAYCVTGFAEHGWQITRKEPA